MPSQPTLPSSRGVHRRAMGALHRQPPLHRYRGASCHQRVLGRSRAAVAADAPAGRAWAAWRGHRRLRLPRDEPAHGLVNIELHRADGSLGMFLGMQSGLAMKSIALHGSDEQKQRWLPAMARLDAIGAFASPRRAMAPTRSPSKPPRAATATAGSSTERSAGSATVDRRRGCGVGARGGGRAGERLLGREG
jgi:hypothetical protein